MSITLIVNFATVTSIKIMRKKSILTFAILLAFSIVIFVSACKKEELEKEKVTVTDYDGNLYQTVQIGNQLWMAKNLKSTHTANGSSISSYVYNDDEKNADIYGKLYTWWSAMNNSSYQGICPTGWHIPSDQEFQTMIDNLGGDAVAGGKMKEVGTAHWDSPNTGANNSSGFNALPAGYYDPFTNLGLAVYFWSSTSVDATRAFSRNLYHDRQDVLRGSSYKSDAVSVRCIKD